MPIYEFKNEHGMTEEHYFSFEDAPPIGSVVVIKDRFLTRIPTLPQISVEGSKHFVAQSQPMCNPDGSVPEGVVPAPRYQMDPKSPDYRAPLFDGKREIERYVSDVRSAGGEISYGE